MQPSRKLNVFVAALGLIVAFGAGFLFSQAEPQRGYLNNAPKGRNLIQSTETAQTPVEIPNLGEVWKRLQNAYFDGAKLDLKKLQYGAVKGFVHEIGDPYTAYMTPEETKEFSSDLEGELEGIGAQLEVKDGKLTVVAPLKNSPAEEAGIKPGDIIYKIDGAFAEEMTFYEAVRKIRGKSGTKVTLTIIREKKPEPFDITITRREITVENVTLKKLDNGIYHLAILQFNDSTKKDFLKAANEMLLNDPRGLILDLRGNGGGYLDISIDILSELLKGEQTGAIIKKKNGTELETAKTNGSGRLADIPLVILVNKGSASASEIVAGAVQDYKRGLLIGETTFGKGSVQEIQPLTDGSSLRFTIAKWFTPQDRSINEKGITPDREVKMNEEDAEQDRDPQLDEAVKYLRSRPK